MRYVALLRGINVGGNKGVDMKELRTLFENEGWENVSTYLNSGNVLFESDLKRDILKDRIETLLKDEYGFEVSTLIKTNEEMRVIAEAIPKEWQNDEIHKTDVAYLFPEIDSEKTLDLLLIKREYIDIRYVKGAIFWNVSREYYNRSRINRIIGQGIYQQMTVRNVNTARYLGGRDRMDQSGA
jgi:uncharacterized protein (DUF1697 family)